MTCAQCGKQYPAASHTCGDDVHAELDDLRRSVGTLQTSLVISVAVLFWLVARLMWR